MTAAAGGRVELLSVRDIDGRRTPASSFALGLLAVSPFFAMTVLAIPHLDLARLSGRNAQPDWRLLLNTLMWNLNCESHCIWLW